MRDRYMRDRMISRGRAMGDGRRSRDSRGRYTSDHMMHNDYRMEDRKRGRDYTRDYNDYYDDDYDRYDYADEDWDEELENWCIELKRNVKTPIAKNEAINKANMMGVRFKDYNEDEFYCVVNMLMTDFPNIAQPETYIAMAKQWLEDKDAALKGSEKLCEYYYTIVKGE